MGKQEKRTRQRSMGLVIPVAGLRRLRNAGIYCVPGVTMEYQQSTKRAVLRGLESGGASPEIGRYVTFCNDDGSPVSWLHPVQGIVGNGVHAVVIAEKLVCVEMLRVAQTYDLLIVKHEPRVDQDGKRPQLHPQILFRALRGHLPLDLLRKDRELAGNIAPEFFTKSGERREMPSRFSMVVKAITRAVNCEECTHSHYVAPQSRRDKLVDGSVGVRPDS